MANDGRGTNVLKDLAAVSYFILPEKVTAEEENLQSVLDFTSTTTLDVLGESDEELQFTFYDDENSEVLGIESEGPAEETLEPKDSKSSFGEIVLRGLEKLDRAILSFWQKTAEGIRQMLVSPKS